LHIVTADIDDVRWASSRRGSILTIFYSTRLRKSMKDLTMGVQTSEFDPNDKKKGKEDK
jgi:hypothetical protein